MQIALIFHANSIHESEHTKIEFTNERIIPTTSGLAVRGNPLKKRFCQTLQLDGYNFEQILTPNQKR